MIRPAHITPPGRQQGAALFVGVFIITTILVVAGAVALTTTTQHRGQALALEADRAWFAALARLESEIPGLEAGAECPGGGEESIHGFSTTMDCQREEVLEGDLEYVVYTLESTATGGSRQAGTLVRRTARTQITDIGPEP